jgi:dTDP-4-dehydrorhamnose 3,5-epimerase
MIEGVIIQELKQIADARGRVMQMLRADSSLFRKFGEIYFSEILPDQVKAWKKHQKMTQHYAVPLGNIKLVMYDDRENSPTRGELQVLEIGREHYCLVRIPPRVWYGFKCLGQQPALVANCADLPHDPAESQSLEPSSALIPYQW